MVSRSVLDDLLTSTNEHDHDNVKRNVTIGRLEVVKSIDVKNINLQIKKNIKNMFFLHFYINI